MVNIRVNLHGRDLRSRVRTYKENQLWRGAAIGILLLGLPACSLLEPIGEPEISDLQLTVDTLTTSLSDAQRTMAELRAEVDVRSQELAHVQIARAQLEGRVWETERRLSEAHQVIVLQREELANSRAERERVKRTGAALQNQLKQLQRQLSKLGKQTTEGASPAAMASPRDGQSELVTAHLEQVSLPVGVMEDREAIIQSAAQVPKTAPVGRAPLGTRSSPMTVPSRVSIKPGDTLWSIARRYHTSVGYLMTINALPDEYIQVGQILLLPELVSDESEHEQM